MLMHTCTLIHTDLHTQSYSPASSHSHTTHLSLSHSPTRVPLINAHVPSHTPVTNINCPLQEQKLSSTCTNILTCIHSHTNSLHTNTLFHIQLPTHRQPYAHTTLRSTCALSQRGFHKCIHAPPTTHTHTLITIHTLQIHAQVHHLITCIRPYPRPTHTYLHCLSHTHINSFISITPTAHPFHTLGRYFPLN